MRIAGPRTLSTGVGEIDAQWRRRPCRDGGQTPAIITLKRSAERCAITLSKEGFSDQTFTFTRAGSRVALANLASGLGIGMVAGLAVALATPFDDSNTANSVALGGVAVGTGVGLLTDRNTGAVYRQVPASVDLTLTEKGTSRQGSDQ